MIDIEIGEFLKKTVTLKGKIKNFNFSYTRHFRNLSPRHVSKKTTTFVLIVQLTYMSIYLILLTLLSFFKKDVISTAHIRYFSLDLLTFRPIGSG